MLTPHHLVEPGTVLFDTSRQTGSEEGQSLLFHSPIDQLYAFNSADIPGLLHALDQAVADGYYVAGYLDYEAGYGFEYWDDFHKNTLPLAWFGVYKDCQKLPSKQVQGLLEAQNGSAVTMSTPAFSLDQATYIQKIQRIKEYIRNGDVYQINFTGSVDFTYTGSPLALYRSIRQRQSVSYGALLSLEQGHMLSFSPELFFDINGDVLTTRPMKGTIHRGTTKREDQQLGTWLVNDEKNQAENVMIVDLLRNDLSRVCKTGSVIVPALYALETYETLFQMTSTVTGTLRPGITSPELFEALFPGGSITGAPKLRAMEIIQELEDGPRGVYCGTIGYMTPDHRAVFNIAIRTVVLNEGAGSMGVGSGIVWDSDPAAEYNECILKGKFLHIPG